MYYLIDEVLKACTASECHEGKKQYVAVLTPEEWQKEKEALKSFPPWVRAVSGQVWSPLPEPSLPSHKAGSLQKVYI